MKKKNSLTRVSIGILIVCLALSIGLPMAVQADEPTTSQEFFEEFRGLEGTPAFQDYEEYGAVRTFATTRIQEVGSLSSSDREEMVLLFQTMVTFNSAYQEYQSENYQESIALADQTANHIESLREFNTNQAALAELGLNRLYSDIAQETRSQAQETESSPEQIELLLLTAQAYEGGDETDQAAQFRLEAENLQAELNSAQNQIDQAEGEANSYLGTCVECDSIGGIVSTSINPIAIFSEYQSSQQAVSNIQIAQEAVATHGLEDRGERIASISTQVRNIWFSLMMVSSGILLTYGLVVAGISTILFERIFAWRNNFAESRIDSVVQMGGNDV